MATVKLLPIGNDAPFFLPTGVAASGYKLFTYAAGTSTKTNTYTDNTGNTANANPIILNSSGYPASSGNVIEIWGIVGTVYKFVLAPSTDSDPPVAAIWSRDNIAAINDQTQTFSEWISGPTPTFINGSQFTLVGDQTNTWTIGRRVQATVTAGTVYGRITASAFTTLTTVTLQLDGTQALDSGLSSVSYAMLGSLVKSEPERIGTSSGTDTYTATVGITRLVVGDEYKVKIASTNTSTTPTLNLDSTGAKTVIRIDGSALIAGDLNGQHIFRWDGTNQVVLNPTQVKRASISETQTANTVFSGPASGGAAAPTFRALVAADAVGFSGLVKLNSGSVTNAATLDIVMTAYTAYRNKVLVLASFIPVTNTVNLLLRVSTDGGGSYDAGVGAYGYGYRTIDSAATVTDTGAAATAIILSPALVGNGANGGISAAITLYDTINTAVWTRTTHQATYVDTGGTLIATVAGGGARGAAQDTDAIRILFSSGNISSGNWTLYGYN